jgi:hypothetical protein
MEASGIRASDQLTGQWETKKERRMAESQAPLLQPNQFVVYLRDHLLLDKNVDALIIKPFVQTFNGGLIRKMPV